MGDRIHSCAIDIASKKNQRDILQKDIASVREEIKSLQEQKILYEKSSIFLQHFSEQRRKKGQEIFSDMGTLALQNIYGEGYRLDITYDVKRNRPIADVNIVSPYADNKKGEIQYSSDYAAGGENDVVSFAMKIALLQAYRPKQDGPVLLDETFKHLSVGHIDEVAELLSQISDSLERQFIFCTSHRHPSFKKCADKSFVIQREKDQESVVLLDS